MTDSRRKQVVAMRNSQERSNRLVNLCWRIWHVARKKKQVRCYCFRSAEVQSVCPRMARLLCFFFGLVQVLRLHAWFVLRKKINRDGDLISSFAQLLSWPIGQAPGVSDCQLFSFSLLIDTSRRPPALVYPCTELVFHFLHNNHEQVQREYARQLAQRRLEQELGSREAAEELSDGEKDGAPDAAQQPVSVAAPVSRIARIGSEARIVSDDEGGDGGKDDRNLYIVLIRY